MNWFLLLILLLLRRMLVGSVCSAMIVFPDLKRSAQKDLEETQTQFPSLSFSSLRSVGRTKGNEENEAGRRGI
jgi:hypothetical protein